MRGALTGMKCWAAAALALTLLLSGCANSSATDGSLANEWPAMQAPQGWAPQIGQCDDQQVDNPSRVVYDFKDCQGEHRYEVIHVGTVAESAQPPVRGSDAYSKAWSECDSKAEDFLGGPWRERRLRIGIFLPTSPAWEGGARWFACQINLVQRLGDGSTIKAPGSLKGKFSDPAAQYGCHQVELKGDFTARSCAEPHNAEFAGVFDWPGTRESLAEDMKAEGSRSHATCSRIIATFVGALGISTGTWLWQPAAADWQAGDHTLRCHFYLRDRNVSGSMKGVGAKGWPIK